MIVCLYIIVRKRLPGTGRLFLLPCTGERRVDIYDVEDNTY